MSHFGLSDCIGGRSKKVDALFKRGSSGHMEHDLDENFFVVRIHENSPLEFAAIDVMVRGECGTTKTAPDPLLDWVYNGVREHGTYLPLPEEPTASRLAWFLWLMTYTMGFGIRRGGSYALIDKSSRKVVAGAICCPPRSVPFSKSGSEMTIFLRKAGMEMGPDVLLNPRMRSLGTWMANTEGGCGAHLRDNFLYISTFATDP